MEQRAQTIEIETFWYFGQKRYRCPYSGCGWDTYSVQKMQKHIAQDHYAGQELDALRAGGIDVDGPYTDTETPEMEPIERDEDIIDLRTDGAGEARSADDSRQLQFSTEAGTSEERADRTDDTESGDPD